MVHALNTIANAPGDWAVTPAVAWVARAALTGRHVDEQDREEILYAVLTFLIMVVVLAFRPQGLMGRA